MAPTSPSPVRSSSTTSGTSAQPGGFTEEERAGAAVGTGQEEKRQKWHCFVLCICSLLQMNFALTFRLMFIQPAEETLYCGRAI